MNLTYVGEAPARQIEDDQIVTHGVPFEVSDELGARLLEQDVFVPADSPPPAEPVPAEATPTTESTEAN